GLQLLERIVDLGQQLGVGLARRDAQAAHDRGLIALGHLQVGIRALGDDAGRGGIVNENALYAARVGIAHHVGRIVVELDLFEDTAFLDGLDKRSAHLHAYGHAFHVGERLVFLVVVLGHHEPFAIAVYRLGETDNLLAGLGNEHGRRDQ